MILFEIKLKNGIDGAEQLFVKGGSYDAASGTLALKAGEVADFETFFNLFPHAKYAKYCGLEGVTLNLYAKGRYRIDVYERRNGGSTRISSADCDGDGAVFLNISGAKAGGYICFTVTAAGDCTICGGAWTAERQPGRQVKIGVVICTYRREDYVRANMARVAEAIDRRPEWADRLHFFIIDNAKTLQLEKSGFYTVIPNRNLGGSGGFTRGITEVCADPSYTHFLLMDDDISFDFSVLERTYAMMSALTDEHKNATLGSTMLYQDRPYVQHESGANFDGLRFRAINYCLDMRDTENLLKNEQPRNANYCGWWYCCMPVTCVKKFGLPMPFFIKCDDVEYGMRAVEELILMNGVAVWHQDFAKKISPALEYYKRNEAVTSAVRLDCSRFKVIVHFCYYAFKHLTMKNYNCAELLLKGYDDFLKGPDFFTSADPEKINAELIKVKPDWQPKKQLEEKYGKIDCDNDYKNKLSFFEQLMRAMMLVENFLPSFLFSKKPVATQAFRPKASAAFLKRTVIHYDEYTGSGFVCTLDKERRKKLRRHTLSIIFKLLFGYGKIKKMYISGRSAMCSEENWNRLFFTEGKK